MLLNDYLAKIVLVAVGPPDSERGKFVERDFSSQASSRIDQFFAL